MRLDEKRRIVTPRQRRALDVLLSGGSVQAAADAARVRRQTTSRWLHHDEAFRTTYAREAEELHEEHTHRLQALIGMALSVVATSLADGNLRAAISLLHGINSRVDGCQCKK